MMVMAGDGRMGPMGQSMVMGGLRPLSTSSQETGSTQLSRSNSTMSESRHWLPERGPLGGLQTPRYY